MAPRRPGKPAERRLLSPRRALPAPAAAVLLLALTLSSCSALSPRRITLQALEAAPVTRVKRFEPSVVTDPQSLAPLARRLTARVDLIHVRSAADWERLRAVAPRIGGAPDFSRGAVVGLAVHSGRPLEPGWPLDIDALRVFDGCGLLSATFHGGSFLADGSTYLRLVQAPDLQGVVAVELNGARFYPD